MISLLVLSALASSGPRPTERPETFVAIERMAPSIKQEMRYHGSHNFLGRPVTGYRAPRCWLTRPAAEALAKAQKEAEAFGMTLKVYDCYRPQRAVDDFLAWMKDPKDQKGKKEFFPRVDKTELIDKGYLAAKSGHSRGSTLDVTLDGLDMGTAYDHFDLKAHTASTDVPAAARRNRLLLKSLLEKQGFKNLPEEWWHFTLGDEPYPETYFDFEVE